MKRICAITMVRNDWFFLRKWVDYYGGILGRENLYILFDGKDQVPPDFCVGTNTIVHERIAGKVVKADKGRIRCISNCARNLMDRYDLAIGTDADEFLAVDPALGLSLSEYLSTLNVRGSVSGLGVDVAQHLDREQEIDASRPFLSQRHYGCLTSRYTKASVKNCPQRWGSGFHRVKGRNYHIDPNLYLFHFGCVDYRMIEKKLGDKERISNGWSRHFRKRVRSIHVVTSARVRPWEPTVSRMRMLQTLVRQIFAFNKPGSLGLKIVVAIPERFRHLV